MVPRTARQLGRLDRYVRKSCLRAPDGASRCRLSHSLEEALRLASLPGEEEGRIYCFRRVNVSGIPAGADRGVWLDKVQHALRALAGHAVHADEPHAGAVDAVYFNGEQEALETVLRRLTHAPVRRDERRPEWFLASFLGVAPEASAAIQIEAALHRLRAPEMPAGAAAAIVLAAIGADDPGPLLAAVPESTVREWVREWTRTANAAPDSPAVRIPEHFREMVKRVAARFGWRDSRASWLALLVLTYLHPTAMAFGNPIHAVRVALHDLEAAPREPARIPRPKPLLVPSARNATIRFDEFDEDVEETAEAAPAAVLRYSAPVPASPAPRRNGEPTASAGLYFLLNALRRLGIATVLETCPQLRGAGFVEHIFKRAAERAGTSADDPILLCLDCGAKFEVEGILSYRDVWPGNLRVTNRDGFDCDYLLRAWVLAIEWWCWRNGRIRLRETIQRTGRVWLTRADLDVTLPMAEVDIRIRRAGLDIDPGWLPWFGKFGKVIRFHYRSRDDGDVA